MSREITVYGAAGCGLCEQMMYELRPLIAEFDLRVTAIDITGDAALEADYRTRIPVLMYAGHPLCEYFLDPDVLRDALAATP